MNDDDTLHIILCPRCKQFGILHADRSIEATINTHLVAHVQHEVQHPESQRVIRYNCMLRTRDLEQIELERTDDK